MPLRLASWNVSDSLYSAHGNDAREVHMPNRLVTTGVACCLIIQAGTGSGLPAETARLAATGTVAVRSDPDGAAVYLDGQFAGRTPLMLERVQTGDHRVRVVKEGYLENGRIIAVSAGETATLQVRLTASGASNDVAGEQTGGISSGPPGSNKKWWYLAAAGGGAAATALVLANRNRAPTVGTVSASPSTGVQAATAIMFSASAASDPDGDSLTYSWEFGDGGTSTDQAPRHVYNTEGVFSVRCTISDGEHSDSGNASVTIRSLAGTWRGVLDNVQETLVLTHVGAAIGGTFVDVFGSGVISGFVSTSPPLVRFTIQQPGFNPFTYTADANAGVTTLTGVLNGSGYNNSPFTIMRQ
jgi:PKD repeat protein